VQVRLLLRGPFVKLLPEPMMKIGYLVRYKKFPHEELHNQGIIGIVISKPYKVEYDLTVVNIFWDRPRLSAEREAPFVTWDYIDELEYIEGIAT
jgi:hypothetical protein